MKSGKTRVAVVYPHLPHYRYGVFKELAADDRLDVTFIADAVEESGTIETIPMEDLLGTVRVKNQRFLGLLWQRGLLRQLARSRPHAVIFLGDASYGSTWVAAFILRLFRVPVFFWTIGWHRPETGLKRVVRLTFYRLANTLLLYGNVAKQIGGQIGYPAERMVRVGNSRTSSMATATVTVAERESVEHHLLDLAPNVVATVVRLNPSKRLDLLVEAGGALVREGVPVSILVVGDGPERHSLEKQADALGVDARFLGALYAEDVLKLVYAAADITVLPSAAGLTVTQSLEHGTPVITHDDPYAQMPEAEGVVPGVTGDVYAAGDAQDLARVMSGWFGGRARAAAVQQACRAEIAENWSPESQAGCIAATVLRATARSRD